MLEICYHANDGMNMCDMRFLKNTQCCEIAQNHIHV